nr:hypothetical protein [Tanacetum cinerariifolium]
MRIRDEESEERVNFLEKKITIPEGSEGRRRGRNDWVIIRSGIATRDHIGETENFLRILFTSHINDAKDETKSPLPQEAPATHVDMEAIAKKERTRLEELLKRKECRMVLILVLLLLSRAKSGVAWQLTLNCPVVKNEAVPDKGNSDSNDEDFYEIKFIKKGRFTAEELESLVFVLKLAGSGENRIVNRRGDTAPTPSMDKSITGLEGMGGKIYGLKETKIEGSKSEIAWEHINGYTQQKRNGLFIRYS